MNSVGGLIPETDSSKPKIRLPWRQIPLLLLPRFLSGFRLGEWWRLLREHRFSIDPIFWPRAVLATLGAALTSILARLEPKVTLESVDASLLENPVFILGLPRSGTTHLFELLSQSPDLCFPTRFDAFNPHTFLLLRRMGLFALLSKLPKFKRAMDNLRVGWDSPEEDIVALAILTSGGERLGMVFPRDAARINDAEVGESEKRERSVELLLALRDITRKLARLHRKRVILKSPGHMTRIREILEVFPEARFVTIFRNPLHQVASMHHAAADSGNAFWCALQWPATHGIKTRLSKQSRALEIYFRARATIPPGHLVETTFEELVADRAGTIARICEKFSIRPPFNSGELAATARNARPPGLPPDSWVPLIREYYKALFDMDLYPRP
jgi:hypothetical protein